VLRTDRGARRGTRFARVAEREFEAEFLGMQRRLDDATVINLWVVFERFVIEHVAASCSTQANRPERFADLLREKTSHEIERWRVDELLDLYKGWVDPSRIGTAKQVKAYRDWVAHRNPRKPPSAVIVPDPAFHALVGIMRTVEVHEPGGSLSGS
jgi:hypothetical protein